MGFAIRNEHVTPLRETVSSAIAQDHVIASAWSDFGQIATVVALVSKCSEPLLVLSPDMAFLQAVERAISSRVQDVDKYTGGMNMNDTYRVWGRIRGNPKRVTLATRLGALVVPHPIVRIVIVGSGEDDFTQVDQNPHYDARWCIRKRMESHKNKTLMLDVLPRLEDGEIQVDTWVNPGVKLVAMSSASRLGSHYAISPEAEAMLKNTDTSRGRVIVYLNRLGDARSLTCFDCGAMPRCNACSKPLTVTGANLTCHACRLIQAIPNICVQCQSSNLKTHGLGTRKIAKVLSKLLPDKSIHILESGDTLPENGIIVATRALFSKLDAIDPNIDGLIVMNADHAFVHHDFRSNESGARELRRLASIASRARVECIIQAWSPESVQLALGPTAALQDKERSLRKLLKYPPFGNKVTIRNKDGGNEEVIPLNEENTLQLLTKPQNFDIIVN